MAYDVRCKKSIPYRLMDAPFYCSAACAQMILESLPVPALPHPNAPKLQDDLFRRIARLTTPDRFVQWTAGPDGVEAALRSRDKLAINNYRVIGSRERGDIEKWMVWSLIKHGLPIAALTGLVRGFEHWVVVYGCLINKLIDTVSGDVGQIHGFFVHNPTLRVKEEYTANDRMPNPEGRSEWVHFVTLEAWRRSFMSRRTPLDRRRFVSVLVPYHEPIRRSPGSNRSRFVAPKKRPRTIVRQDASGQPRPRYKDQDALRKMIRTIKITRDDAIDALKSYGLDQIEPWRSVIGGITDFDCKPVEVDLTGDGKSEDFYFLLLLKNQQNVPGFGPISSTPIAMVVQKERPSAPLRLLETMAVPPGVGDVLLIPDKDKARSQVQDKINEGSLFSLAIEEGTRNFIKFTLSFKLPEGLPGSDVISEIGTEIDSDLVTPAPAVKPLPVKVQPYQVEVGENLVWSPSFNSTTRFLPFYSFKYKRKDKDKELLLRIDAFHELRDVTQPVPIPVVFNRFVNGNNVLRLRNRVNLT